MFCQVSKCTLEAKAKEDRVSVACAGEGARLAIMSALALPPSESCRSIVSLEFLQGTLCPSVHKLRSLYKEGTHCSTVY